MRVRSKFNISIDALGIGCHNFVLKSKENEEIKCRIIKFKLSNNEIETLITNLFDYNLGIKHFQELYFLRWPIETEFSILKNDLEIENFSSITIEGIHQDFFIAICMTNIISVAAHQSQIIIDKERKDKKININIKVI